MPLLILLFITGGATGIAIASHEEAENARKRAAKAEREARELKAEVDQLSERQRTTEHKHLQAIADLVDQYEALFLEYARLSESYLRQLK